MRVIILTDLEGVSGVDSIGMMDVSTEGYKVACQQLMKDVNAAVDGAIAGGAEEVFVVDGHFTGKNFLPELLDPRAKQMPCEEFIPMQLDKFDAIIGLGCHAKAGTEKAFLDHTINSSRWFEFCVDGNSYGEIGMQAIAGGAFSVPLVMVSGDDAACVEARELIPNIATASVKRADVRNTATCLPEKEALDLIFNAAADGVKRYKEIAPYRIKLPVEKTLTLYRNDYCDEIFEKNPALIRNGRTLTKRLEAITCYGDVTSF